MNHLDEVSTAILPHPVTARLLPSLGTDRLEDGFDGRPGGRVTSGHQGRTVPGSFLTPGDSRAHKEDSLLLQGLCPSLGVLIFRVASIYDDVSLLQQRDEVVYEC